MAHARTRQTLVIRSDRNASRHPDLRHSSILIIVNRVLLVATPSSMYEQRLFSRKFLAHILCLAQLLDAETQKAWFRIADCLQNMVKIVSGSFSGGEWIHGNRIKYVGVQFLVARSLCGCLDESRKL
jgi:hypothetical protein